MDINILPFLLCVGVVSCFHTIMYEYHFINNAMTWSDARQYCRRHYTDLATIWSLDDVDRVERPSGYGGVAWIGLFDDPASWRGVMGKDSNSWRWSVTGSTSPGGFQNWATGQPDYAEGTHQCVKIRSGLWYDSPCSDQIRFACFNGVEAGTKSYTLISTSMTWEQARSHCRERYTDLAMIENESENTAVASLYPSGSVWIGLYREPWRWSDGSQSTFTNWPYGADSYNRNQHCVREEGTLYRWNDRHCSDKFPFICQQVFRTKTSISMKLQSGVDLSETEIHNQIIQQIGAELVRRGITDVILKWKSPPLLFSDKKKIENQTDITCTNNNVT